MGRFGQPRYKDPVGMYFSVDDIYIHLGTPPALRGIREVTDKNKHIMLEAIFNGDFIPDHLLPVGIHRCGQQRWRAHLCTVGHKFSGPPREAVREACEDRRKFCEENGVNFVLYGKQTHAKGPIGSRPVIPSAFPRLSDYVTSMSRASTGGGGNSQALLSGLKSNSALKPFFDCIEETQRILAAKKAEEEGNASYVVTKSHAALHRRIVEDIKDGSTHMYSGLTKRSQPTKRSLFSLAPISVDVNGEGIKFLWSVDRPVEDPSLAMYLASIVGSETDVKKVIETDVANQVQLFKKIDEKYDELMSKFKTISEGIRFLHQHTPHVVHTRKTTHNTPLVATENLTTVIEIVIREDVIFNWDVFTRDTIAEDFAKALENDDPTVSASDVLFTILDKSVRHRMALLQLNLPAIRKGVPSKPVPVDESHSQFNNEDIDEMQYEMDKYRDECISNLASVQSK